MSNDWTAWEDLYGGVLVGSLPTVSMLLTSLLTFNAKISSTFESTAQNFCAGLIIGAVAKELFPQIDTDNKYDNLVGISVGFFIGIIFVNFLDYLVDFIQHNCSCCGFEGDGDSDSADNSINGSDVENSGLQLQYQSIGSRELVEDSGSESGSEADQSEPIIMLASQAIASPMHRERIRKKISDLVDSISSMEEKSQRLASGGKNMGTAEAEVFADQIDEEIHKFQYNLDHCRRLIQGSGSDIEGIVPRLWISEKDLSTLSSRLAILRQGTMELAEVLSSDQLNSESIVEIHNNLANMDDQLNLLHDSVEAYSFKWGRRGKKRKIPIPSTGSKIPLSLLIPVTVDCVMDGFLVGSTSAISLRAGVVLGFANFIEMGFLGLAVSVRVQKCTGSSLLMRYTSLIVPPLIMLLSAVVGSLCGVLARIHPRVYIGFISFGIVALLYLVVNELLVEAREALGGQEYWWTAMILFAGIYAVILMDIFF